MKSFAAALVLMPALAAAPAWACDHARQILAQNDGQTELAPLRLAQAEDKKALPAREPHETSVPSKAPPATPEQATTSNKQDSKTKAMMETGKERIEKEGK
jgi:hypothetical protein